MFSWSEAESLEHRGEWSEARSAYQRLFREAVEERAMEAAANALRGTARVYYRRGWYEEAEEMAELSRVIAEGHGLLQAAARAVNVVASVRHARQDWRGAEARYEEAFGMAMDAGDDELIGLTCQNLGILANIRGDLHEARTRYLESIGSFVRCGSERNAAITYNNLGMVCSDLAEWFEAEIFFDRGIEIAERLGGSAQLLASLYTNRTETLLHLGDLAGAGALLDRAEAIATRIAARATLADIARFRGVLARLRGDLAAAGELLVRALTLAGEAGTDIGRAEAAEELGRVRRLEGRDAEARELLTGALGTFRRHHAERDALRVDALLHPPAPLPPPAAGG